MASETPFFRPEVEALAPYQPGRPIEEVQRELGLARVVKLASNEGPLPPFPAALAAMERAARELNRYPDGGCVRLQEALAARHGVGVEQVCAGAGADGCLDLLSQAVLGPGDEVVCGWPSFASYPIYAAKQGAVTVKVPLTRAPLRPRGAARSDLAADEDRLRLPPEQPDRDDEHARAELDSFLERAPGRRARRDRPGLLRVRRPRRLPRRDPGATSPPVAASSCCAPSRRSTASPGSGSATRSGPSTSARRWRRSAVPSTCRRRRRRRRSRASPTPTSSTVRRLLNVQGRDGLTAILRRHGLEPVARGGRELRLRRARPRRGAALRAAARAGCDRPAARRLRRADGDPRLGRDARRARRARRGARRRHAAALSSGGAGPARLGRPPARARRRARRASSRAPRRRRGSRRRSPP